MLTKHEPAPACNHCNEEHVYVVNIMHVMMYVPRSQCSHCIITECMLIDVCFVMHVTVFCPGFQKGRVPSQKGTFSAVNGLSKGHFSAVNGPSKRHFSAVKGRIGALLAR